MSQFIPAISLDSSATGGTAGVSALNTGNDAREFSGEQMVVMVWDDQMASAAFSWDLFDPNSQTTNFTGWTVLDGNSIGAVTDPDIVLSPSGNKIFIVYVINNDIYYESWSYSFGTNSWSLSQGATQISGNGTSDNPNIDMSLSGEMVITWQESGDIMALAGDVTTGISSYLSVTISGSGTFFWPDVSLYEDSNGDVVVKFTYLEDNPGGGIYELIIQEEDLADVQNGTPAVIPSVLDVFPGSPGVVSRPRIATNGVNLTDPSNYTVVIRYSDSGGSHFIQTYSVDNTNAYGPTVINDYDPDLTATSPTCLVSDDPVVTYVDNDNVFVAWTYDDDCFSNIPLTGKHMIVKQCDVTGSPYFTTYSIVKTNTSSLTITVNELYPSIAGRYSSNNKALYTYYMDNVTTSVTDVEYKYMPINSNVLRPSIQAQQGRNKEPVLILYPNPALDLVNMRSKNREKIKSTKVFDLTGRLILQIQDIEETVTLGTTSLEQGIYIVQCLLVSGKRLHARLNVIRR